MKRLMMVVCLLSLLMPVYAKHKHKTHGKHVAKTSAKQKKKGLSDIKPEELFTLEMKQHQEAFEAALAKEKAETEAKLSDEDDDDDDDDDDDCNPKIRCIRRKDLRRGFVITKPGVYCLKENLRFKATAYKKKAITINADCVKLCFNCFSLEQEGTVPGAIGVYVASGRSNVTIEDGTIKNFTSRGIHLNTETKTVNIKDMKVLENGRIGDVISSGLLTLGTTELSIVRSQFIKNFGAGITVCNSKDVTLRESDCNQTQGITASLPATTTTANGLVFNPANGASQNIRIENCSFNCAKATRGVRGIHVLGFAGVNHKNILISNTTAYGNRVENIPDGSTVAFAVGIIITSAENVTLHKCVASSNGTGKSPNTSLGTNNVTGISVSSVTGLLCENCIAESNETLEEEGGKVRGFLCVFNRGARYINCKANKNFSDGSDSGSVIGFDVIIGDSVCLEHCSAKENFKTKVVESDDGVTGFTINDVNSCVVSRCISSGQNVSGNESEPLDGVGFHVKGAPTVVFSDNVAIKNATAGFRDDSTGGKRAFRNNCAQTNGTNYVGLAAAIPTDSWDLSALVAPAFTNKISNLDIF